MYVLAINCGSSSIKGKLFPVGSGKQGELSSVASLAVSNISSKGEKVKIKITWENKEGQDISDEGEDGGSVEYQSLVPLLLSKLTESGKLEKRDVKYVVHRVVHGGTHKKGIQITKDHTEGLKEMDRLSAFAPLHNHHAVLAVRSCLDALPDHTSLLVFDTLFHQTIPPETYTYALPPPDTDNTMPIRKYGFHGLSYASIVHLLSAHLNKPANKINVVVAHLGSGASACCIKSGESQDTSMGLTPLEGLIGGTRTGTIDPTAVFHQVKDPASDAGIEGMQVTKAEAVLNKNSGLQALAGTTNMGKILAAVADPATCSKEEHERYALAYAVYLDRLMGYVSQYLCRLLATVPLDQIDGIVFSGGIGEKAVQLRKDVLERFAWLGAKVAEANEKSEGQVRQITADDSKLKGWVVETDEEGWCAKLAQDEFRL